LYLNVRWSRCGHRRLPGPVRTRWSGWIGLVTHHSTNQASVDQLIDETATTTDCLHVTGLLRVVKQQVKLPVHVMIRPRAGDFHYSDQEMDVMRIDIKILKENGADGFVLGLLHRLVLSAFERTPIINHIARRKTNRRQILPSPPLLSLPFL